MGIEPKHSPSIKNEDQYEALRDQGYSKEKAARISNSDNAGKRGGKSIAYEKRSKKDLYAKAKELGIEGRSKLSKSELIYALRNN